MIDVRQAATRFETVQPGITTRHCFSSGAHYEPANTAFGTLIAVDDHVLAPGAGFVRHAHRGVEIVSWVLEGTLCHEDSAGRLEVIEPGTVLYQSAGSGIEHAERNASGTDALRFVQMMLLGRVATPSYRLAPLPLPVGGGVFTVLMPVEPVELDAAAYLHLFIARGPVGVAGQTLQTGDSARVRDVPITVEGEGEGEILAWRSGEPGFA